MLIKIAQVTYVTCAIFINIGQGNHTNMHYPHKKP